MYMCTSVLIIRENKGSTKLLHLMGGAGEESSQSV